MDSIRTANFNYFIGTKVGTCTIMKELGRGAMGVVYTAYQGSLKRLVAIKILPKEFVSDVLSPERFRQEAETAAYLTHPNIVPIYEIGETDDFYYIIMQLVRGKSLGIILSNMKKHPVPSKRIMPFKDSIKLIINVLDALGFAHREGTIHQDIKPDNILIEEKTKRAMITDFGIARLSRGENLPVKRGVVVGTPIYMAPEQAAGKETDGRADIYSVGVLLFLMVAGGLPVRPETGTQTVIRKITNPDSFFLKRPSQINPNINPEMEMIIFKAIASHPDLRFHNCQEFIDALKKYYINYISNQETWF